MELVVGLWQYCVCKDLQKARILFRVKLNAIIVRVSSDLYGIRTTGTVARAITAPPEDESIGVLVVVVEIAASSLSPKVVEIEGPASSVLTVIARSVGAVIDGAAFR